MSPLYFVIALPAEARPLLRAYQLKQVAGNHPFPLYQRDQIWLIVSGIGKTLAAAATAYLGAIAGMREAGIWLNIGIAGHSHLPIGSAYLAHSIEEFTTGNRWFPQCLCKAPWPSHPLLTNDTIETNYTSESLFDMEAAGFFRMASKLSTLEFIHSIKIVSDSNIAEAQALTPALAEQWIGNQIGAIKQFIEQLQALTISGEATHTLQTLLEQLSERFHLSVTEQHQTKIRLQKMQALQLEPLTYPWGNIADRKLFKLQLAKVDLL